jgi:hypothetical protein
MKTTSTVAIALILLSNTAFAADPVSEQRVWNETYVVQTASPRLVVDNIWGGVKVRTGGSGEISVSAVESRSAPDRERFERSFESINVNINADVNGVSLVVGNSDERAHRMNDCHGCRLDIQFEILVPPGTTVDVGTVMDGRINIEGVSGVVSASNVNGPVEVDGILECASIESVNGKIDVGFSRSPSGDCRIDSINGNITLDMPDGSGMDVALDLFNGKAYSEFDGGPFNMPATVERTVDNGHKQYRIQKLSGLRIGAGGPIYSISSMNGDVRIQKHQ